MTGWLERATQVPLALDAGFQAVVNAPDASAVLRIRAGRDEEAIHCPVVVWTEGQAVVRLVIVAFFPGDNVGGLNE